MSTKNVENQAVKNNQAENNQVISGVKAVENMEALKKAEHSLNHRNGVALKKANGLMIEKLVSTKESKDSGFVLKSKVLLDFNGIGRTELMTMSAENGVIVKLQSKLRNLTKAEAESLGAKDQSELLDKDGKLDTEKLEISYLVVNVKELYVTTRKSADPVKSLEKSLEKLKKAGYSKEQLLELLEKA